jgi:predicted dehydrogenase
LTYYGEQGRLHATDQVLQEERSDTPQQDIPLPLPDQTIDSNFVAALASGSPLCCSADEALETVRLLEAIRRSATTGQIVRII